MARRLLAAGHSLTVFNRTAARAAPFGTSAHASRIRRDAAAQKADVIIGMTANDESSRAMWLGEQGALAADNSPDALAIECSTLSHDWVLELAAARARARFPLCRCAGDGPARRGGDRHTDPAGRSRAADLDAARPIFASLATRVLHFGPVGQGTVYKLMINLMGAVQIASAAEGMVLAERAGLDLKLVADAVASGQAASPQVVRNVRRFVAGDHSTNVNFTPALRLKDIDYALRLANKSGVRLRVRRSRRPTVYRKLCAQGFGRDNESRIIDAMRRPRSAKELAARIRACRSGRRRYRALCTHAGILGLPGNGAQQHAPGRAAERAGRDIRRHHANFGRESAVPDAAHARAR